mgnify:CR=1 FL=1
MLVYLVFIHSLMLITLFSLLEQSWSLVATVLFIGTSFIYYCRQQLWVDNASAIIRLERDSEQRWYLLSKGEQEMPPLKLVNCVVIPSLVMLTFHDESFWRNKTVTLVNDAVDDELFRQLRVYCRNPKTFQE